MSKKLYVYGICLAVVYVVFIGHRLYEGGEQFISGFQAGWRQSAQHTPAYVCGGNFTPIQGATTFPSQFLNVKTGEKIRFEIKQGVAFLSQIPDSTPMYIKIMDTVTIVLYLALFALFIYLPFVVYRIVKSISKNNFYSIQNINYIRRASFILLGIFFVNLIASITNMMITNVYMQMEGYKSSFNINYSLLFMGLVVLALSEILKYTTSIQEEQVFTI